MTTVNLTEQGVKISSFSTAIGVEEFYLTGTSPEGLLLRESLNELAASYRNALIENNLDESTQQFVRIFLSDSSNEEEGLLESEFFAMVRNGSVSVIEQSPIDGGSVGFLAYHIKSSTGSFRREKRSDLVPFLNRSICTKGQNYSLLWSTGYTSNAAPDSETQTRHILSSLASSLAAHQMTIRNNTVRTWLFVRDVDNNYAGMVKARREYFETIGLTAKTRYIASTGIEGKSADNKLLVYTDALSIGGLKEEQIVRIEAPRNLSDTIAYGVTFERGTRVRFGDRSHLFLSGTASIDKTGATIHICDIRKQVERTFDNIEALWETQGATLDDMQYLTLYLRNPKHYPFIQDILAERLRETMPVIAVYAPVCRPNWLFEVDGLAIIPDKTAFPPLD
jgi:enamine deaminase RidA (YjgF/YER057c/UK114 family)